MSPFPIPILYSNLSKPEKIASRNFNQKIENNNHLNNRRTNEKENKE